MSAKGGHDDKQLFLFALGVFGTSAAIGASVGASRLGLYVPAASAGSLADAMAILLNNLTVCALLAGAAVFQPRGIAGLSRGFLPLWLTDLAVVLVVSINLVAIGGVIGALGFDAVLRIVPHAPFELGGYLVVVAAYLRARRGGLGRREALRSFAAAGLLLASGAWVESYVSGALL